MKTKINKKRAILWGAIAMVIQMVVGNLLYMNPIVMKINKQFEGHPTLKSFDFIGGMTNWLIVTMIFSIGMIIFWIILYIVLYDSIPGKGILKGLIFGLFVGLIRAVPEAFNQWMLLSYPSELILIQLINTFIGLTLFGLVLGFFYKRFKVIEE